MTDDGTDLDPAGSEPPPLSPEDEAAVHELLASLPDPEVPADVADRILAALAAEAGATRPATVAVLPTPAAAPAPSRHAGGAVPGARRTRLAQVAAGVAVLALAGGVAVSVASHHGSGSGTTAAPSPQAASVPVTVSRTAYTEANLDHEVQSLLVAASATASATTTRQTSTEPAAKSASGATAAPTAATSLAAVTALVEDPARRDACVAALAGTTTVTALAIDVGTYRGRPAAVVVLPDANDPTVVDAWVVGSTCSDQDKPFPYDYHHVPRP